MSGNEVDYVLQRIEAEKAKLATRRHEVVFDTEGWRLYLEDLKKSSLSQDQAKRLLFTLSAFCSPVSSFTYAGFTAIYESLVYLAEVRAYVNTWDTPGHPEVQAFNKDLDLHTYLSHEEMGESLTEVLSSVGESYVGGFSFDPRLLAIYYLMTNSQAYRDIQGLVQMGLMDNNKEPLETFFERRNRAIAAAEKTDIVSEALTNIEANKILQIQYAKVLDKVRRKDYVEFIKLSEELRHQQNLVFSKQEGKLTSLLGFGNDEEKANINHQLTTLKIMKGIRDCVFEAVAFFAERELFEGMKLVDKAMPIHHQMVQVCDNSVALIFIGLLKTGKSTIVDTIIGENVSPSRVSPMTAIPVRYVHDPKATEPVMLVPFANELNRVVRAVKKLMTDRGKDVIIARLKFTFLKDLAEKIDKGLIFQATYTGIHAVHDASLDIHDLYRLAVQDIFPPALALELPLDWDQGLDSFLTVSIRFPHNIMVPSGVKLSVIDTPGVNEDGVKKLDLKKVIADAVDVCHYVAFTIHPNQNSAKDNTSLKDLISRIATTSMTPTLVLATHCDTLSASTEEIESTRINIANSLQVGSLNYPKESVFLVSGKKKLMGDSMRDFITTNGRKPGLKDENASARTVASSWALFAGHGFDEDEKKAYYEKLEFDELTLRCEKLILTSNMIQPLDRMVQAATKNASILSCNKAIEKTLGSINGIMNYLQRLLAATKADASRVADLTVTCLQVNEAISHGSTEIRHNLNQIVSRFKLDFKAEAEKTLRDFIAQTLPTLVIEADHRGFRSKAEAETKLQESMRLINQSYNDVIDAILYAKRVELEASANSVQAQVSEKILKQLARIFVETEVEEMMSIEIPKPDLTLDASTLGADESVVSTQEKKTSIKSKFVSLIHFKIPALTKEESNIDVKAIRDAAKEALEEYTQKLVATAAVTVDRVMARHLDTLFLVALRKVNQAREALSERDKLRDNAGKMETLLQQLIVLKDSLNQQVKQVVIVSSAIA